MTNQQNRPMMELDFVLQVQNMPGHRLQHLAPYIFPGAVFESPGTMLLVPLPVADTVYANITELMPRLERECAYVAIPYLPPVEKDPAIYSWGVHVAWCPISRPAMGEMMVLNQYREWIYDSWKHLATPFEGSANGR